MKSPRNFKAFFEGNNRPEIHLSEEAKNDLWSEILRCICLEYSVDSDVLHKPGDYIEIISRKLALSEPSGEIILKKVKNKEGGALVVFSRVIGFMPPEFVEENISTVFLCYLSTSGYRTLLKKLIIDVKADVFYRAALRLDYGQFMNRELDELLDVFLEKNPEATLEICMLIKNDQTIDEEVREVALDYIPVCMEYIAKM